MLLFFLFFILGVIFGLSYFFSKNKFSPEKLLLSLWLLAIGVAQLRLSPLEQGWNWQFWLLLVLFFSVFIIVYLLSRKFFKERIAARVRTASIKEKLMLIVLLLMTVTSLAANYYIFSIFGTLPILSSVPDKLRFIINRQVFGAWEYLSLLPRIYIPLTFIFLLISRPKKSWLRWLLIGNIILGFAILSLYASRLIMVITILLCYFSYLIWKIKTVNFRQIIISAVIVVLIISTLAVSIPAFRQYITYRDYHGADEGYNPFTYITSLARLNIPASLNFITPLYLIPSFNLQAMMRSVDYLPVHGYYLGNYNLSVFNPLLKIFHLPQLSAKVDWQGIFQPWWNTATFLFDYFADFGWPGIIMAAVFWGVLLSLVYVWAIKKSSLLSVMLFAYFSFTVIMSIYINYFSRPEMYLDLALIFIFGLILENKSENKKSRQLSVGGLDVKG